MNKKFKPVALFILDGWGIRETLFGNAVVQGKTPNYDKWLREYERSILDASGQAVGLTDGQMGNSEVGHLNIGAGRVVYQDITRIDLSISDGSFKRIPVMANAFERVKASGKKLHFFGLVGPGGVHSHSRHLYALLEMAKDFGISPIVHAITDGRDTPPTSGINFIKELEEQVAKNGAVIGSLSGRYYSMDRDKRWDRTKKAYDVYVYRQGETAASAHEAVEQSYAEDVNDEFILPTVIPDASGRDLAVESGDTLLFFNFRADRMRQIVKSFCLDDFEDFETKDGLKNLDILTFTEYEKGLPVQVIYPKINMTNPIAEVISKYNLKQFHAAETEKYSHVTFFFNGGREAPFEGEERLLIQSPKVATYDLQPEMSAYELTDQVEERIKNYDDDFLIVNFANPDMVGHTGILEAGIKAVETVDECIGRLVKAVIEKGGIAAVTADHGNAEIMKNKVTGEPHTYHSTNPVNFFLLSEDYFEMKPRGILADIAPTLLQLMGLPQPEEMTGKSLILHEKDVPSGGKY